MGLVQVEACMRAGEVVHGIMHLGNSLPVVLSGHRSLMVIRDFRTGRLGEKCQVTGALGRWHGTEKLTILIG